MPLVRIPYKVRFRESLTHDVKVQTARFQKMGNVGDVFLAYGHRFIIDAVYKLDVETVARDFWADEGCDSEQDFRNVWREIHPKRQFISTETPYVHRFHRIGATIPAIPKVAPQAAGFTTGWTALVGQGHTYAYRKDNYCRWEILNEGQRFQSEEVICKDVDVMDEILAWAEKIEVIDHTDGLMYSIDADDFKANMMMFEANAGWQYKVPRSSFKTIKAIEGTRTRAMASKARVEAKETQIQGRLGL